MRNTTLSTLLIVLLGLFAVACKDALFSQREDFPHMIWDKEKPVVFKADIANPSQPVHLIVGLRHGSNTQYGSINIRMTTKSPSGTATKEYFTLDLRDKTTGKLVGEAMGDICDTEITLKKNITFTEAGVYEFEIGHEMDDSRLQLMMDLELRLIDANKKK